MPAVEHDFVPAEKLSLYTSFPTLTSPPDTRVAKEDARQLSRVRALHDRCSSRTASLHAPLSPTCTHRTTTARFDAVTPCEKTSSYHIGRQRELQRFALVRRDLRRQPLERQCTHCRLFIVTQVTDATTEAKVADLYAEVGVDPASCLCLFVYTTTLSHAIARRQVAMNEAVVVQVAHAGGDLRAKIKRKTDG